MCGPHHCSLSSFAVVSCQVGKAERPLEELFIIIWDNLGKFDHDLIVLPHKKVMVSKGKHPRGAWFRWDHLLVKGTFPPAQTEPVTYFSQGTLNGIMPVARNDGYVILSCCVTGCVYLCASSFAIVVFLWFYCTRIDDYTVTVTHFL